MRVETPVFGWLINHGKGMGTGHLMFLFKRSQQQLFGLSGDRNRQDSDISRACMNRPCATTFSDYLEMTIPDTLFSVGIGDDRTDYE